MVVLVNQAPYFDLFLSIAYFSPLFPFLSFSLSLYSSLYLTYLGQRFQHKRPEFFFVIFVLTRYKSIIIDSDNDNLKRLCCNDMTGLTMSFNHLMLFYLRIEIGKVRKDTSASEANDKFTLFEMRRRHFLIKII